MRKSQYIKNKVRLKTLTNPYESFLQIFVKFILHRKSNFSFYFLIL